MKAFSFLLVVSLLILANGVYGQEKKFSFTREKMASPFTIVLFHHDSSQAVLISSECFELVDSFVNIFSDYIANSELNQLSAFAGTGKWVTVSPALFDIISESARAYRLSGGAFDITMAPVIRLWRKARREKRFPDSLEVAQKMKAVGFNKVKIDKKRHAIQLGEKDMLLDLGGIAQGYIAQKVLERLYAKRLRKVLVDVSGDIAAGDPPPAKAGWVVGINLPEMEKLQVRRLLLKNFSVSTSGDLYQYVEHNGVRYSHIIDPATGYGITSQRNVTVIAANATTADWLATACSILPANKALQLANKLNSEVLIAENRNGVISSTSSKNFANFYDQKALK